MLREEKRKLEGFEKALEELRSEIAELERQLAAGNVAAAKALVKKDSKSRFLRGPSPTCVAKSPKSSNSYGANFPS